MIVLDTSVLSSIFRRSTGKQTSSVVSQFSKLVEDDEPMAIPGIVLQELLSGVKSASAARKLDDALSGFPLVLATRETHLRAAHVRTACRDHGIAASTVDCLIAAHAIEADAELFTLDEDFTHIARHSALRLAD